MPMPPCRFFLNSECANPNCNFIHPVEYPIYIYTVPGIDIHPDELRWAVMCDANMAKEADNVWINNFKLFCSDPEQKSVDILEFPSYFCMPFDPERVAAEIELIKNELSTRRPNDYKRQGYNNYQKGGYRNYDNRTNENKPYQPGSITTNKNPWKSDSNNYENTNRGYETNNRGYEGNDYQGNKPYNSNYQGNKPYSNNYLGNKPYNNNYQGNNRGYNSNYQGNKPYNNRNSYNNQSEMLQSEVPRPSFTPRQAFDPNEHPNGFDRAQGFVPKSDGKEPSQEYEQYNVPYNYK